MNTKTQRLDETPITFLNAEPCPVKVMDSPQQGYACENDTFIQASGDSDTN